jgi:tetratricopeptide (TPR) repeat protein
MSINQLAIDLREAGELEEAEALFRELVSTRQQLLEPDDFQIGRALGGLAKTLEAAGKLEEGVTYGQLALDHRHRYEGDKAWITNLERLDLARILHKLNRTTEALTHLTDLERSIQSIEDPDDDDRQLLEDARTLRHSIQTG